MISKYCQTVREKKHGSRQQLPDRQMQTGTGVFLNFFLHNISYLSVSYTELVSVLNPLLVVIFPSNLLLEGYTSDIGVRRRESARESEREAII